MNIEMLDVKNKIMIVKSNSNTIIEPTLRKSLLKKGCLGIVVLPEGSELDVLGIKQLQDLVDNIKARTSRKDGR